ncbi:hypothetical protein L484_009145 [Morus notabilis]|uniref:Uncharacterized protein n=1 Tax=Morus notabilis TaxID=981085 RepID=W9RU49_9ROSA|nr:hypothetical protein L484_009145 [Morus notabilis]
MNGFTSTNLESMGKVERSSVVAKVCNIGRRHRDSLIGSSDLSSQSIETTHEIPLARAAKDADGDCTTDLRIWEKATVDLS